MRVQGCRVEGLRLRLRVPKPSNRNPRAMGPGFFLLGFYFFCLGVVLRSDFSPDALDWDPQAVNPRV